MEAGTAGNGIVSGWLLYGLSADPWACRDIHRKVEAVGGICLQAPIIPEDIATAIKTDSLSQLQLALDGHPTKCPDAARLNQQLALAITHNSITIIPHPVSLGASPLSDPAWEALLSSSTFPSLMTLITSGNLDINTNLDRLGTFLILAIKRQNVDHVKELLSHNANPDLGLYAHIYTPLASAVEFSTSTSASVDASVEIITLLLNAGARIQGSDALHLAALHGRMHLLRRLLESKGADVNEMGFEYCVDERMAERAGSVLHFGVDGGNAEVVGLLLEYGADREKRDVRGRTALERAREQDKKGAMEVLHSE